MRCVRRDTIDFTRQTQAGIVEHVCHNRIEEAIQMGRDAVRSLFAGEVPFDQLVTSKKLSSRYKVTSTLLDGTKFKVSVTPHGKWEAQEGPEAGTCEILPGAPWKMLDADGKPVGTLTLAQPHVHVMHRSERRARGSGPRVGDRVAYVFKANADAGGGMQFANADDPVYCFANGIKLDVDYYFEHSVRNPLEAILEVFVKSPYAALGWQCAQAEAINRARGQTSLASTFGFGTTNGVTKTSKIARVPKRKAPPPLVVVAKKASIAKFFTKKD